MAKNAGGGRRRRVLVRVGVALGVIVVVLVAARLLVPAGMVRDLVASRLGQVLDRPVTVGQARGGLLPRPWVELRDLAVAEGADGVAANVAELRLRLRWGPLLRRAVEIDRAEIVRPAVNVRLAVADTVAGTAGAPVAPPAATGTSPVTVRIEQLVLTDGAVTVTRTDGAPVAEVRGLGETLALEATPAGDVAVTGTTRVDTLRLFLPRGTLGEGIPITWTKDLRWEQAAGRLRIDTSELALGELRVAVTGAVTGLGGDRPLADLELAGGPAELASLQGYLPSGLAPGLERWKSSGTAALGAFIRGPFGAEPDSALDWGVRFSLTNGTIENPDLPAPVRDVALVVAARPGLVHLERLEARTGLSRLAVSGEVTDPFADPAYRLEIDADVDLAEATALRPAAATGPTVAGEVRARITARGRTADPGSLALAGPLFLKNVTIEGPGMALPVRDLAASGRIDGRVLRLDELFLRQGRSDYRLTGTISDPLALLPPDADVPAALAPAVATIALQAASTRLDVDEMLAENGRGASGTADSAAASGATAAGKPAPPAALDHLRRLAGDVTAQVDTLVLRGNVLTDVKGVARLDRGMITLESATARGYGGAATLAGTVDVSAPRGGRLDLQLRVADARAEEYFAQATAAGRFTRLASALVGRIDVDATLAGALDDTLGLDLRSITSAGRVAVHDAKLAGLPLQNQLVTMLDAPQLAAIDLRDVLQPFRIDGGRLMLDDVAIRVGPVGIGGSGWQALDGELSARLDLTLPPDYAQGLRRQLPAQMADLLLDEEGSALELPLRVSGQAAAPVVRLDMDGLAAAAAARAEARLARESDRLKQQAIEEAARGLQDLLKLPADSTAAGADSTQPQTLEDVGRSLLDRLRQGKKGGG